MTSTFSRLFLVGTFLLPHLRATSFLGGAGLSLLDCLGLRDAVANHVEGCAGSSNLARLMRRHTPQELQDRLSAFPGVAEAGRHWAVRPRTPAEVATQGMYRVVDLVGQSSFIAEVNWDIFLQISA